MAYGSIAAPKIAEDLKLPVLSYNLPSQKQLVVFPLTLKSTPAALLETMSNCFAREVESESAFSFCASWRVLLGGGLDRREQGQRWSAADELRGRSGYLDYRLGVVG